MNAPAKRLTIGRGFNRRVTKAGKAAEERLRNAVETYMTHLNAHPSVKRTWQVETKYGPLHISFHGSWIATIFDDYERARAVLGAGYSGKWNHHFTHEQLDEGFESFKRQLDAILVKPQAVAVDNVADRVKSFLDEIEAVCQRHGLSIWHEDEHGAFIVEAFSTANLECLRDALIEVKP